MIPKVSKNIFLLWRRLMNSTNLVVVRLRLRDSPVRQYYDPSLPTIITQRHAILELAMQQKKKPYRHRFSPRGRSK